MPARSIRLLIAFCCVGSLLAAPATAQHNLIARIALPTDQGLIAVNSTTNRVYTTGYDYDQGDWTVTEIDGATSTVLATIVTGTSPAAVFMDEASNRFLIVGIDEHEWAGIRLTAVDGNTHAVTHLPLSYMEPAAVTVNPVTGEIFVVGYDGQYFITVIEGAGNTIVFEGPIYSDATSLAVNTALNRIYMGSAGGNIAVVDAASREIVDFIVPELQITNLAFDATHNVLWVEGRDFGETSDAGLPSPVIAAIDGSNHTVLWRTHTTVARTASAFNLASGRSYVTGVDHAEWPDPAGLPWMAIVDAANPGSFTRLPIEFRATAMAVNPATNRIYVMGTGAHGWFWGVAVLDGAAAIPSSPPTPPANLYLPGARTNALSVELTWDAATDDVGIVQYEIVRNDIVVGNVTGDVTSFLDVDVPEEAYSYWVRAFDTDGLTAISQYGSILVDRTPPTFSTPFISPPKNQDLVATSGSGAPATWTVATFEAYSWPAIVSCSHQSGSVFPIGVTLVTCTATDQAGNSASTSFTITVKAVSSISAAPVTGTYGGALVVRAVLVHSANVPLAGRTIAFHVDGAAVGTGVTSSSGEAMLALTAGVYAGTHVLRADFSGDEATTGSTVSTSLVVAPASLTISAVDVTKVYGQAVPMLSATALGLVDSDTVASLDGALALATTATAASLPGTYGITVGGVSSPNYVITFVPGTLSIVRAATTVAVGATPEPSAYDGPMTFTAVVSVVAPGAGMPTGTVSFFDGSVLLGTTLLTDGIATLATAGLDPGTHPIEARFGGDALFEPALGASPHQVLSAKFTPSIDLSSSVQLPRTREAVTFAAAVNVEGTSQSGMVAFHNGPNLLGTAPLVSGTASFTTWTLPSGSHAIYARYLGTADVPPVTSSIVVQTIRGDERNPKVSSIAVTTPTNPSAVGASVEFHVTVSGSSIAPTGRVLFMLNGTVIGDPEGEPLRDLSNTTAAATLDVPGFALGVHKLTATYLGDATFRGSTVSLVQTVR